MAFKFSLNVKNKPVGVKGNSALGGRPPGKKKPLFEDGDEEEDGPKRKDVKGRAEEIGEFNLEDTLVPASKSEKPAPRTKTKPSGPPNRKPLARPDDPTLLLDATSTKESERLAQEMLQIDPSVYDYDAAYDAIHARQLAKKAAEREEALERKPKYMENLFESAELRKKDQIRARDKLLQREREAEGDEFADKEKFVTGAYKLQQEEARRTEEEEKKREEIEDQKRRKHGMQSFHKQMLLDEERRHQEAVEAAAALAKSGTKLTDDLAEKTDADIAKELKSQGKNILLNDEGQVADKRQLLTAGLNVVAKPKKIVETNASTVSTKPAGNLTHYKGRNSAQRDIRARHTQMIAEQIEQAAKRKADEDAEQQRKLQHASKSQKTASDISSARERYLQRKREAAAAKAAAESK